jgi:tetratricopeptide (TPR) repeat protein
LAQFETAVERDPTFAAAWARIAETHHVLAMMGITPPKDAYPAAQAAATRALGAAPDLATAHLAQGLVHLWFDGRPADAAAAFERAIGLNPSLAAAHHDYAWALVALGRTNEAIDQIQQSRDLDPISTRANNDVGWLHLFVRQPENAARACEHTLAIDPRSLEAQACLERAYAQQQQFDAALHAARATLSGREDTPPIGQGADGLREIWQWRLRQLERAAETRWINPYTLAVHYALVGDSERAIAALERAYDARVGMLTFLARDPAMDSLRGLPRFDALLTRISRTSS